jgi:hypothetical protein
MFGPARASAEDTREEVGRFRPHVLAVDWVLSGAVVAGEAAGVPVALLMHGNNLVPEPGKPAPGFGFLPARSVLGRARDRVFTAIFRRLLDRGLPALNQARQALGLRPLGHVLEQLDRPAGSCACTPRRSTCGRPPAGAAPLRRAGAGAARLGRAVDLAVAAGRPAAAGGGQHEHHLHAAMRQERVLRRCVDAVASMPVRALVTVGPALDPAAFHGTGNVVVVGSAPHDQVFRHASAVVTHAGMGTVMRALADGLPLVCMPQGRDQNDVAARVRWHGAGLRLGPRASAARIRAALRRVLEQPSFREAAERLRQAIQADLAAGRAVTELEALTRLGRAVAAR